MFVVVVVHSCPPASVFSTGFVAIHVVDDRSVIEMSMNHIHLYSAEKAVDDESLKY